MKKTLRMLLAGILFVCIPATASAATIIPADIQNRITTLEDHVRVLEQQVKDLMAGINAKQPVVVTSPDSNLAPIAASAPAPAAKIAVKEITKRGNISVSDASSAYAAPSSKVRIMTLHGFNLDGVSISYSCKPQVVSTHCDPFSASSESKDGSTISFIVPIDIVPEAVMDTVTRTNSYTYTFTMAKAGTMLMFSVPSI